MLLTNGIELLPLGEGKSFPFVILAIVWSATCGQPSQIVRWFAFLCVSVLIVKFDVLNSGILLTWVHVSYKITQNQTKIAKAHKTTQNCAEPMRREEGSHTN